MFYQCIETRSGNRCHSSKYGKTGYQRAKFLVQPRIVVAQDKEDQENGGEAKRNGQAGTKQNSCNYGEWAHAAHFTHG